MKYNLFIDTLRQNSNAKIYHKPDTKAYDWWKIVEHLDEVFVLVKRKFWSTPSILYPSDVEGGYYEIELPKLERWAIVSPNNAILYWAYTRKNAHRIATKSGLPCRVAHFIEVDDNHD